MGWLQQEFYSGRSLALLAIILVIALVVCVYLSQNGVIDGYCMCKKTGCNPTWDSYVENCRGEDYFVAVGSDPCQRAEQERMSKSCYVTAWAILHISLYTLIGFIVPDLIWLAFIISIIFEMIESIIGCHCALDLVWNFSGLAIGYTIRKTLFHRCQ